MPQPPAPVHGDHRRRFFTQCCLKALLIGTAFLQPEHIAAVSLHTGRQIKLFKKERELIEQGIHTGQRARCFINIKRDGKRTGCFLAHRPAVSTDLRRRHPSRRNHPQAARFGDGSDKRRRCQRG